MRIRTKSKQTNLQNKDNEVAFRVKIDIILYITCNRKIWEGCRKIKP